MLNNVQIIGNLGQDVELRYTASGDAVANFSVATSRRWNDAQGEKREETTWFRVTAWRRLAETCAQYLAKGRQVYVEGHIKTDSYEKDGVKHYTWNLVAEEVKFLGGGGDREPAAAGSDAVEDIDQDDLPFAADPQFMGWPDEHGEALR